MTEGSLQPNNGGGARCNRGSNSAWLLAEPGTAEFREPITTERQVVYILVELRKLLEGNGTLDQYRTLKTCCDWAVHPKLSQASAQAITKLFDEYEAKYRSSSRWRGSKPKMPQLVEFCEHTRFRAQLIVACEANGIDADAISDDGWWRAFLTQSLRNRQGLSDRGPREQHEVRYLCEGVCHRSRVNWHLQPGVWNLLAVGAKRYSDSG